MSLYSRNLKCLRVQSSTAHTCTLSVDELYSMLILFNTSKCSLDGSSDISSTLGTTVFKVCSNAVTMTSLSSSPLHSTFFCCSWQEPWCFFIYHISLANWLRLAKAFLNSVRKEGIAEHSPQFLLREQITAIYALVELHEGSSMVMPLTLSSLMAEMTELDM